MLWTTAGLVTAFRGVLHARSEDPVNSMDL
jgi:hypothetical protein